MSHTAIITSCTPKTLRTLQEIAAKNGEEWVPNKLLVTFPSAWSRAYTLRVYRRMLNSGIPQETAKGFIFDLIWMGTVTAGPNVTFEFISGFDSLIKSRMRSMKEAATS